MTKAAIEKGIALSSLCIWFNSISQRRDDVECNILRRGFNVLIVYSP